MKPDEGQQLTDELLKEYEAKISEEYRKAVVEVQAKLDDYLRRFAIKDEAWKRMVSSGEKTAQEYAAWRQQQIMVGRNWEKLRDELAEDYHNANVTARKLVEQMRAGVYAENVNFGTFEVEKAARIDSSFTLYNREAVEKILREQPELLQPPGKQMREKLAAREDIAWQEGQIQSVTLQSILQGESIPSMTKRIAREMGDANHKATIRYARTACTCAENAGRQDAYHRAEELGVDMQREWRSVWDGRTRYSHRQLDGQVRGIDEPFDSPLGPIMFPGDPNADPANVWNCRCRTSARVNGLEPRARKYRSDNIEGETYEEWKNSHEERTDPIEKQERIAEAMKWRTINELYKGR